MNIKQLETSYGVLGQIELTDLPEIAEKGFATLICNRPDSEIEAGLHSGVIEAEANRLGITFVYNPISPSGLTPENLEIQASAKAESNGPVLAYCRSGMRSTMVWSLLKSGRLSVDEIVTVAASAGYNIDGLRPKIEALAA